jgi:transposase-like protein
MARVHKIACPACGSQVTRKFGHAWTGKQRYLCNYCDRQFTRGTRRTVSAKPNCPKCRRTMNLYKREGDAVRFRCSGYPGCRTYLKIDNIGGLE